MDLKALIFLIILFSPAFAQAQTEDSLATIYFYRERKSAGAFVGYSVVHNDKVIGRMKSGKAMVYQCQGGQQIFTATTEGKKITLYLNVASGKSYYVECGISSGAVAGIATLRQTKSYVAKSAIKKIDPALADKITIEAETNDNHNISSAITAQESASMARDSLGIIYFYRKRNTGDTTIGYDIARVEKKIGRLNQGNIIVYRCKAGKQTFSTATQGKMTLTINVVPGETYYVECGVTTDLSKAMLYQVNRTMGKIAIDKINNPVNPVTDENKLNPLSNWAAKKDTVRAVQHLFQRKSTGGYIRIAASVIVLISSLISQSTPPPPINTGYGTITTPSASDGSIIARVGLCGIFVITGIAQASNYSHLNLTVLLDKYRRGMALPLKIKSKLKQKDFR